MPHDGQPMPQTPLLADLFGLTAKALPEAEANGVRYLKIPIKAYFAE